MDNIKLLIWDLDETLWSGTLAEKEKIVLNDEFINIIIELSHRGIMNSIASKNNFDEVRSVLEKAGIWKYFIFPQISWKSKGKVINELLQIINLRPENVLFIDDNHLNLEEVAFYNKNINVMKPNELSFDILNLVQFQGKDDKTLSRLRQYKDLEKRYELSLKFDSNEEFLRQSNITINIQKNVIDEFDRIYELIHRTNQLNYTKNRISKLELNNLIADDTIEKFYVECFDDYGDYGIVGFVAIKDSILEHFLFSCRVLGLGIENYIYNKLGFPKLTIKGEVAIPLEKKKINWISENRNRTDEKLKILSTKKILMIAGCDLEGAAAYLENSSNIKKEFAIMKKGINIRTSYVMNFINQLDLSITDKKRLANEIPFIDEKITFKSKIFDGSQDIIIWSLVDDYIAGIYREKMSNIKISYRSYFEYPLNFNEDKNGDLNLFRENFQFTGGIDSTEFIELVTRVLNNIDKKNNVILINGTDMDLSDWTGVEMYNRYQEMNDAVDKIVSNFDNVHLLDMRKILKSRSDYAKKDCRHYVRKIYYDMARELLRIINSLETVNE